MHDQQLRTDHELEAYQMGVQAALNAASWIVDGNTKREFIPAVLNMFEEGDPAVEEYLPAYPNLSGEWADDMTIPQLFGELGIHSVSDVSEEDMETIADAWETGVSDTFYSECERILRAALED